MNMSQMAEIMTTAPARPAEEPHDVCVARGILNLPHLPHWRTAAEARVRRNPFLTIALLFGARIFLREEYLEPGNPARKVKVRMLWCPDHNGVKADCGRGYSILQGGEGRHYYCLTCAENTVRNFECRSEAGVSRPS